jgi:hypothetical protein
MFPFPGAFIAPGPVAFAIPRAVIPCSHPYCSKPRNDGYLHCSRECGIDHRQIDSQGFSSLFIYQSGDWVRAPSGWIVTPPMAMPNGGGPGFILTDESRVPRGYTFVRPALVRAGGGVGAVRGAPVAVRVAPAVVPAAVRVAPAVVPAAVRGGHVVVPAVVRGGAPKKCRRPDCPQFAAPSSRYCSYDCKSLVKDCEQPGCGKIAETGMDYCLDHATMDDVDPRVALLGFYHEPRPEDRGRRGDGRVRDLYS